MFINYSKPFINESNLIRLTFKAEETSFFIHTICFYYTIKQIIINNTIEKELYIAKYLIVIEPKKTTYLFLTSMSFEIDMILLCMKRNRNIIKIMCKNYITVRVLFKTTCTWPRLNEKKFKFGKTPQIHLNFHYNVATEIGWENSTAYLCQRL